MDLQKVISKKPLYMIRMATTMECVNVAGTGAAPDHHPPPPLPHRLHLDRRHPHAPTRRQAQVAPTSLHCFVNPDPAIRKDPHHFNWIRIRIK
jgi:hypothetical protein